MTVVHDPEDQGRDRYDAGLPFSYGEAQSYAGKRSDQREYRMTLCGSEVPQDRWRGRTAGSGMWTRTRDNLLSWSLDDPAIPSG